MSRKVFITSLISFCLIITSFFLSCKVDSYSHYKYEVFDFPNVLNVQGVPEHPRDRGVYCFSDKGAWMGFSLPDSSSLGGFSGPYIMGYSRWLSQCFAKAVLMDSKNDQLINFQAAKNIKLFYYPGQLEQSFQIDNLELKLNLWFVSNRSALVKINIINKSNESRKLELVWEGNTFMEGASLKKQENGIVLGFDKFDLKAAVLLPGEIPTKALIAEDKKSYKINLYETITINPGESYSSYLVQSVVFSSDELSKETPKISKILSDPEKTYAENKDRWNGYLNRILTKKSKWLDEKENRKVAVKSIETLMTNWRTPVGDLYHDGLFPSYILFTGFWAWDSWKHSAALAYFAPELAKDQIRTMFDYQDSLGMVADCIFMDKLENNWRDTKPPLASWAVWKIYEETQDKDFIKEIYPKLEKYHQWWYQHRDHDQNGLCEFGSTDGTLEAAGWESGMDNAVRFDSSKMVQNDSESWSLNQESVDLNSYLYEEKLFLAQMAEILRDNNKSVKLKKDAQKVKELIQTRMFDKETGFFFDIKLDDDAFINIFAAEGWTPLFTGVATAEQAERVKQVMMDKTKFDTFVPLPTLAADHPEFNPERGYWRGPNWLDQVYFGIAGLQRYGYTKEADYFINKLLDNPDGLKNGDKPIYENYNPVTGGCVKRPHFSWSAAHLLLLLIGK